MPNAIPVETKLAVIQAALNAGGSYKVALFTSAYTATTPTYGTTNEVTGDGYTAGGKDLTGVTTTSSGTTAFADAADVAWEDATITGARYAVIYDTANSNRVVAAYDFGADQSVVNGTLTVIWPAADAANAMLRLN